MILAACANLKGIIYRQKRYFVYIVITILSLIVPFVRLGDSGGHVFLLSFDHKQLHFMGIIFDMQELYLMPFLSILLFLGIFFMTTLAGRMWCGWACPQTIFRVFYRDLLETKILGLRKKISNKQKEPDMSIASNKVKRFIALGIWLLLCLCIAANFLWYFVPPEDFFSYVFNDSFSEHPILWVFFIGIATFLFFDITMIKENFCFFVCPYCRVQSVLYDKDTIMTVYDYQRGGNIYDETGVKMWKKPETPNAECTGCEACVSVCPTHIDIRKGLQLECINCLECADACVKVMGKFNKPSLISWTSMDNVATRKKVQYFRLRTVAYIVALSVAFVGLIYMSSTKENMLLNINRASELYHIRANAIENSYAFLFQNTSNRPHTYYFEILNNDSIHIKRPKNGLLLEAGEKSKVVVVLESSHNPNTTQENLSVPLVIRAYAEDDDSHINVQRNTVFIYPPKK